MMGSVTNLSVFPCIGSWWTCFAVESARKKKRDG